MCKVSFEKNAVRNAITLQHLGRFPFTKKFGKNSEFPFGKSAFHLSQGSIRGSRGRPGRIKDRERHGTDEKDEKSVLNGTQISIGWFPPGKRDYHFRNSVYSGKFQVERTKKSWSIYIPTGITGIFWEMENAPYYCQFSLN